MAVRSDGFAPRSKAGWWLGRSKAQVAGGMVAVALMVVPEAAGVSFWSWWTLWCFLGLVVCLTNVGDQSVFYWAGCRLGYGRRTFFSGGVWTSQPGLANGLTGLVGLPSCVVGGGQAEPLEIVNTSHAGSVIVLDRQAGYACVPLMVDSMQWAFRTENVKNRRLDALMTFLRLMAKGDGLISSWVFQTRKLTRRLPARADAEGFAATDEAAVAALFSQQPVFQTLVVPRFDLEAVKAKVKRLTPGALSQVVEEQVGLALPSLGEAGVVSGDCPYLSLAQLRGLTRQLWDEYVQGDPPALADNQPLLTSFSESDTCVRVADRYARTLWLDTYPQVTASSAGVEGGWMGLLEDAVDNIVITQEFKPVDETTAQKELRHQERSVRDIQEGAARLSRSSDLSYEQELRDIEARRNELSQGLGSVEFKTLLTVWAGSRDRLDRDCERLKSLLVSLSDCSADPLAFRQGPAWATCLPLGRGL